MKKRLIGNWRDAPPVPATAVLPPASSATAGATTTEFPNEPKKSLRHWAETFFIDVIFY
jgi:hypothetical protein